MANQYKAGAIISYCAVGFNTLAGLIYTPWMISSIGADNYGLYTLALSVINFFLMDFGLSNAVSRFLSKYYAEGEEGKVSSFLGMTYKAYLAVDLVISAILLIIFLNIDTIYSSLSVDQMAVFKVLYIIIAFYSVIAFPFVTLNGVLISNEKFVALNTCELFQKITNVLLIVICLFLGWGVYALVAINALTSILFSFLKLFLVRSLTSARADLSSWDVPLMKEVIGFSLWVTVSQVAQRLIFAVMPSIIAITATTWDVTVFGLASSLEGYVWTVANALNNMFMPKVSRALISEDREELQDISSRYGRIQLYIVGFIIVCFFVYGRQFVDCWVGPEYAVLWICVSLLLIPALIELPQFVAGTAVIAANEVRAKGIVFVLMATLNVVLGYVFTLQWGALGGCLSICAAYLFRTAGMNLIYRNRLNIDLPKFYKEIFSQWCIPAMFMGLVGCLLLRVNPLTGWLAFFSNIVFAAAMYSCLLWSFSLNEYEKDLIRDVVRKIKL